VLDQLGIELCMSGAIKLHALDLAVFVAFIGIEETGGSKIVSKRLAAVRADPSAFYSPISFGRIHHVSHTNPICRGGFAYA
jgi:hypothetical protein